MQCPNHNRHVDQSPHAAPPCLFTCPQARGIVVDGVVASPHVRWGYVWGRLWLPAAVNPYVPAVMEALLTPFWLAYKVSLFYRELPWFRLDSCCVLCRTLRAGALLSGGAPAASPDAVAVMVAGAEYRKLPPTCPRCAGVGPPSDLAHPAAPNLWQLGHGQYHCGQPGSLGSGSRCSAGGGGRCTPPPPRAPGRRRQVQVRVRRHPCCLDSTRSPVLHLRAAKPQQPLQATNSDRHGMPASVSSLLKLPPTCVAAHLSSL